MMGAPFAGAGQDGSTNTRRSETGARQRSRPEILLAPLFLAFMLAGTAGVEAQAVGGEAGKYERVYAQPKSVVEKALKELQPSMGGRLPVLEGFAVPGSYPLSRYQRAYFQAAVQVAPASGGTRVRVSTKLTANGRIESDLLDQLADVLSRGAENGAKAAPREAVPPARQPGDGQQAGKEDAGEPMLSAPMPRLPDAGRTFSSPLERGLAGGQPADGARDANRNGAKKPADKTASTLQAEAASLEEVLKSQAHPKNLVAVKKSGTPVVASPSLNGQTLFMASAHDEFEMLDFSTDWVHVRVSGLSRGWIWRTSLEMPEGISDVPSSSPGGAAVVADLFQVTREENAPFPGDWEPLRGRKVKIISVQKIQENEKNSGAVAKLEFAKSLLDKDYAELAASARDLAGVVFIFDSVDGGMIAATLPTVQAWKAGTLTDAALWHQCYFDPPETFSTAASTGGQ